MEILTPASYISSTNWAFEENSRSTKWTAAENKQFENALAVYDKDAPDRWQKVAAMIPGKTVNDVMKQYKELEVDVSNIEAGLIPIPGYSSTASPFTLDWVNTSGYDGFKGIGGKRSSAGRPPEQERKKGVPWTEEEHKLFLLGLKKYGKGDWRNISRNFVITRTPTQVASHAQKYFIRQLSGGKDKRRASIHDITTVNLNDITRTPSPPKDGGAAATRSSSPQHSMMISHYHHHHHQQQQQPNSPATTPRAQFQWNQPNAGVGVAMGHEQMLMSPYGVNSYGLKMQSQFQNLHRTAAPALHESSYLPPQTQNMVFQTRRYSHA